MRYLTTILMLFLVSCSTPGGSGNLSLRVEDSTGLFSQSKSEKLLDEATMIVNQARRRQNEPPLEYKGDRVWFRYVLEKQKLPKRESDMKPGQTMAGASYRDGIGIVHLFLQCPNRASVLHELAHLVLLSNGIEGHPDWLEGYFKNWRG